MHNAAPKFRNQFNIKTQLIGGKLGVYYFDYSFTPLFDAQGKVYGVMNTAAEATDLVIAKQKVERSEQNFRNMVKQAPVATCILLGRSILLTLQTISSLMADVYCKASLFMQVRHRFSRLAGACEKNQRLFGDAPQKS